MRHVNCLIAAAIVAATTAHAGELSIVPEVGVIKMSSAPDDFWYEQAIPHDTDFRSTAFGASVRYEARNVQVSVGWRNLGNQHQSALIIADDAYFACRGHASACPRPSQYWTEGGSEQQTFAEVGYKFKLSHGYTFEPSVGLAETRIVSHVDMYFVPGGAPYQSGQSETQHLLKKFFGLTVQKGNVGVGVYLLDTEPNRYQNSWGSPIQGSSAVYARLTYAFKVVR